MENATLHDRVAGVGLRARMVLHLFATHADPDNLIRMSRADISARVGLVVGDGVEPTHAARLMRSLVDSGLVRVVGRIADRNNMNEYELLYPPRLILQIPSVKNAYLLEGFSPAESVVYMTVAGLEWSDDQQGWHTSRAIAQRAGVTISVLRHCLRSLIDSGYLTAEPGANTPYPMKYLPTDKHPKRAG